MDGCVVIRTTYQGLRKTELPPSHLLNPTYRPGAQPSSLTAWKETPNFDTSVEVTAQASYRETALSKPRECVSRWWGWVCPLSRSLRSLVTSPCQLRTAKVRGGRLGLSAGGVILCKATWELGWLQPLKYRSGYFPWRNTWTTYCHLLAGGRGRHEVG